MALHIEDHALIGALRAVALCHAVKDDGRASQITRVTVGMAHASAKGGSSLPASAAPRSPGDSPDQAHRTGAA